MKQKIFLIKRDKCKYCGRNLEPAYSSDKESIDKLKLNTVYRTETQQPRNPKQHKKMFALGKFLIKHCNETSIWHGKTPYAFLKAAEMEYGFVEYIQKIDGEVIIVPQSLSYESMATDIFNNFFEKVVNLVIQITGVTREQIDQNLIW